MRKKIILITGATDGIGKVAALELARQGHQVIVHGRNEMKAKGVVKEIKENTNNMDIDYLIADLFSFDSIKSLVNTFEKKYDHLDVLINNAGAVLDNDRFNTKDGLEGTMALNVFSPMLLNFLLLDSLKKSESARIINTSSASHSAIRNVNFQDLNFEKETYSAQKRYGTSKLFVIWLTRHMDKELKKVGVTNVTVNTSHPGAVATNFGQDSEKGFMTNMIYKIALPFMSSPEKGASTNVFLATSQTVEGVSGKYFGNSKEEKPNERLYSEKNEKIIWNYVMDKITPYIS